MFFGKAGTVLALTTVFWVLMVDGDAQAENRDGPEKGEGTEAEALESELRLKEDEIDRVTGALVRVGDDVEDSQARVDQARAGQRELGERARRLQGALEAQEEVTARSRSRLEAQVRVAYKGRDLEGMPLLIEGLFGGGDARDSIFATMQATRLLTESSRSIQHHEDAKQNLRATLRQLEQSKAEYRSSADEGQGLVEELQGHESELRASVEGLGLQRERMEDRLAQLQAEEEAGLLERPPATGGREGGGKRNRHLGGREREEEVEKAGDAEGAVREAEGAEQEREDAIAARERELEIAREEIVVRSVEPIPYEEYVRLYKESAERYGFAGDWYVLAAVGKIESNHGQSMGPSSAGAMGPMQFLPSTWSSYGVDGDGDGTANIMDPEDAIPAAASYLKAGGAPEDWYAALFTYNRAGWYVEEVLAIAESYRRVHGDDSVDPYLEPVKTTPDTYASPRLKPAPPQKVPDEMEEAPEVPASEEPPPEKKPRPTDESPDEPEETTPGSTVPSTDGGTTAAQYRH